MCVMIHGLKRNLRREEQLRGMETNPYGFALLVLRGGRVACHLRTLDEGELMAAWDRAEDDDYVVTHSRIPSAGGLTRNLDDCHLWNAEGCYFAHNGTMRDVIDAMDRGDGRTDSRWLFDEVFLPLWEAQGRRYTPLVGRVLGLVSHGSRLLVVTPDGEVHTTGDWIEDHGCWFSNRSYVVPRPVAPTPVAPMPVAPMPAGSPAPADAPGRPEEPAYGDGDGDWDFGVEGLTVSDGAVLRTALLHYVATWAAARRVGDVARDISRMAGVPAPDVQADVRAAVEAAGPGPFAETGTFVMKDMGDYVAKGMFDELAEAYRSAFVDDVYLDERALEGAGPDAEFSWFQSRLLAYAWAVGVRYRAKARRVDRAFTCVKADGKPLSLATLTGSSMRSLQALHDAATRRG